MVRIRIQLTEEQAARLRRLAAQRGVSIAQIVREAVDQYPKRAAANPQLRARALIQRRLGLEAVRALRDALLPLITTVWIDQELHERALAAVIASRRRDVSLVDRVSFEVVRIHGCRAAFAFDDDFPAEGIATLGDGEVGKPS